MYVISIHFIHHLFFHRSLSLCTSLHTVSRGWLLELPSCFASLTPFLQLCFRGCRKYLTEVGPLAASSRCCSTAHSEGLSHALFGCEGLYFLSSSSGAVMEIHGFPKLQSLDSTGPYSPSPWVHWCSFTVSISSIYANHAPTLLRLLSSFWGLWKVIQTFLWPEFVSAEFSLPWGCCRHCPHAGNRNVTLSELVLGGFFYKYFPVSSKLFYWEGNWGFLSATLRWPQKQ